MSPPVAGDPFPHLEFIDEDGAPAQAPPGEALYAFFKTTCPTCELTWPYLERIRQASDGSGFSVLAVSQDSPEEAREFAARTHSGIATVYDPAPWKVSEALGLETVPTLLLVGADGRVREAIVGFQKSKMRELAVRAAQRAGRVPQELFRPGDDVPELRPG